MLFAMAYLEPFQYKYAVLPIWGSPLQNWVSLPSYSHDENPHTYQDCLYWTRPCSPHFYIHTPRRAVHFWLGFIKFQTTSLSWSFWRCFTTLGKLPKISFQKISFLRMKTAYLILWRSLCQKLSASTMRRRHSIFNPNPGTFRKLHKGVTRAFRPGRLYYATTVNFPILDLFRALLISFLIQASNLSTRLLYFVKYGKWWEPKIFVSRRVQVTA